MGFNYGFRVPIVVARRNVRVLKYLCPEALGYLVTYCRCRANS